MLSPFAVRRVTIGDDQGGRGKEWNGGDEALSEKGDQQVDEKGQMDLKENLTLDCVIKAVGTF